MAIRFLILVASLALVACSDSDDLSQTGSENDTMTDTTTAGDSMSGDGSAATGDVAIEANIRVWTESNITIDYTLTNNGSLELIVFDVGFNTTSALGENEQVQLLKAKRDTGDTDFEQPPTIAGRNFSPEQTISGSANRQLPISIDFTAPLVSGLTPDSIEFCIGYGNADDIIPTTRVDGTFPLNADLEFQTLVCTVLERL